MLRLALARDYEIPHRVARKHIKPSGLCWLAKDSDAFRESILRRVLCRTFSHPLLIILSYRSFYLFHLLSFYLMHRKPSACILADAVGAERVIINDAARE